MTHEEWHELHGTYAQAEGWSLCGAEGSSQNEDGRSPIQLQFLQDGPDDGPTILDDDYEAMALVVAMALAESLPHLDAIRVLREHSPGEIDVIEKSHPAIKDVPA